MLVSCVADMCATCLVGLWAWRAAALFPQSATLDLSPRLQDSLLVMRMRLAMSPDPLIHGRIPTDSTQIIAVD